MSSDNGKQVDDALEAIRKLVEMSEQKLDDNPDIVTLDHVVWRNPVADEDYDDGQDDAGEKTKIPATISLSQAPLPPSYMTKLSLEDDDDNSAEEPHSPEVSGLANDEAEDTIDVSVAAEKIKQPEKPLSTNTQLAQDITELGTPIGRRGGGFYQDPPKKPAVTSQPPLTNSVNTPETHKVPEGEALPDMVATPRPETHQAAPKNAKPQISVSSQHFSGQDFSLPASEAFMTPASLKELSEADRPMVNPDIQVPIADPPVADPVREVQIMFEDDEDDNDEWSPVSQPNLQLVSDSRFEDDETEEEGFSGTVRSALRSIIKEQVTSWLHNNMTDLIEDALSAPPQRPARPTTPKSQPKRRDK